MSVAAFRDAHKPAWLTAALGLACAAAAAAIGYGASQSWQALAMATGTTGALGLSLAGSWLLPVAAIPAAFVDARLLVGSVSLSLADLAVLLGAVGAAAHLDWRTNRRVVLVLSALVAFEVTLAFGILANPGLGAVLEMAHRATIVGGSLVIGAYLAQRGKVDLAIALFIATAVFVALASVVDSATHGFGAAFPFGLQKNYAGSLLSSALVVSLVLRPARGRLGLLLRLSRLVLAGGLLATQSRGALIGLAVGALVASLITRKYRVPVLVALLIATPLLMSSIDTDLLTKAQFGSVATHIASANDAVNAWRAAPLLGNGLRFFEDATASLSYDPHNVVLLTLAESGVAGLFGMLVLLGMAAVQLWHKRTLLAIAALSLLAARFAHGMVDIYWVHGSQEVPWLIVGMALGTRAGVHEAL